MATRTRLTARGRWVFGALGGLVLVLGVIGVVNLLDGEPSATVTEVTPPPRTVVDSFNGTATVYGPGMEGGTTASGEPFNSQAAAAAHPTLAFGTVVRVTHLGNGSSVEVVINDRLPDQAFNRIDLTIGAGQVIGLTTEQGVADVLIEVYG